MYIPIHIEYRNIYFVQLKTHQEPNFKLYYHIINMFLCSRTTLYIHSNYKHLQKVQKVNSSFFLLLRLLNWWEMWKKYAALYSLRNLWYVISLICHFSYVLFWNMWFPPIDIIPKCYYDTHSLVVKQNESHKQVHTSRVWMKVN